MLRDVVDDAQAIPHRVNELAVYEFAPAWVDTRRRLAAVDKQPQALLPRVIAEVVEAGAVAGSGDEFVEALGRHGRRYYTAVENKC
jgi:hypothetical protein